MPRHKLISDDEVLDATRQVIRRRGPVQFTLADVAEEVGLARSTLIQRFENRDGLYRKVMERSTKRLRTDLDALPGGNGPQELWRFLQALVSVLKSERINEYLLTVVEEMADPFLAKLARKRVHMVRDAIFARLPQVVADRQEVARHLQAVMQGASMQWAVEREDELSHFVAARLRTALILLFPEEVFDHQKGDTSNRVFSGLTGASMAVAYAYMADISDEKSRPESFGLVAAALGVGLIAGPDRPKQ